MLLEKYSLNTRSGDEMPVYSMTAYGFGETAMPGLTYTCEIRTLNSRFLEVSVRLPRPLIALETDVIAAVKAALKRGKVDVFLDMARQGAVKDLPSVDPAAARHYASLIEQLKPYLTATGAALTADPVRFLTLEGVLADDRTKGRGPDQAEVHRDGLFGALDKALSAVRVARAKEGESLVVALLELTRAIERDRVSAHAKRDTILGAMHKMYLKRLENVFAVLEKSGQPVSAVASDERLVTEIAMLADKSDIEEELTRLKTHVAEFERLMAAGEEAVGRKLDFMCQEMHREVNTMSNKLVQTDAAQLTLEMKQNVERIRQQVQNIE